MPKIKDEAASIKVIREAFIIIMVAIIPVIAAYLNGGEKLLTEIVTGLLVHKWIMYCTAITAVVFVAVAFLDWYLLFDSEKAEKVHHQISIILFESATSFIGILRVTSGVLIAISILWVKYDFNMEQLPQISWIFFMGIIAAVECVIISSWLNYIEQNWLKKGYTNGPRQELIS